MLAKLIMKGFFLKMWIFFPILTINNLIWRCHQYLALLKKNQSVSHFTIMYQIKSGNN